MWSHMTYEYVVPNSTYFYDKNLSFYNHYFTMYIKSQRPSCTNLYVIILIQSMILKGNFYMSSMWLTCGIIGLVDIGN